MPSSLHIHIRTLMIAIAITALPLALVAQGYVWVVLFLFVFVIPLIAMPILAAELGARWGGVEGRPMTLIEMAINLTSFAILVAHAILFLIAVAILNLFVMSL